MVARIGIAVTRDTVTSVVVNNDTIGWSGMAPIEEAGVGGAVGGLITQLPRLPWPRPQVWLAIDDRRSQPKVIRGLPAVTDRRALSRIVAATPLRFFVSANGALATTGVQVLEPGVVRAAAFPLCVLGEVQLACERAGLTIAGVVPADTARAALGAEGQDASIAAAVGAARTDRREPLVYRPKRASLAVRGQRVAGAGLLLLALAAAATVPSLYAQRTARRAQREIARIASARATAVSKQRELDHINHLLSALAGFETKRLSMTLLLSQLTRALPAGSAITALTADSSGITLVALAPLAADVVREVNTMPGASHVELVGPVTRELVNGTELDRVVVRFRAARDWAQARRPFAWPAGDHRGSAK